VLYVYFREIRISKQNKIQFKRHLLACKLISKISNYKTNTESKLQNKNGTNTYKNTEEKKQKGVARK
jgi:hypothetical protein